MTTMKRMDDCVTFQLMISLAGVALAGGHNSGNMGDTGWNDFNSWSSGPRKPSWSVSTPTAEGEGNQVYIIKTVSSNTIKGGTGHQRKGNFGGDDWTQGENDDRITETGGGKHI